MASMDSAVVKAFGKAFTFHQVDYDGSATTFQVDASARAGASIAPASGPTVTLGSAASGLKTVTLAAGGSHTGGKVVVVIWHGGGVIPAGYIGQHA